MKSNPGILSLLTLILGSAPRLADIITRRPHVFDGLLDPSFSQTVPEQAVLRDSLVGALARAPDYEAKLDAARVFASEQKFLIGARLLTGAIDAGRAGRLFSLLADILIDVLLDCVWTEFARRHGQVPGARLCVLGMGRLGSRELTAGSDLDLVLLYDHDPEAEYSDGDKPLAASQYFIRLTQRMIAAMSAPTSQGVIYELDFRLRPSGNAGPLATHLDSFVKYQREEAWTWERQALTRARALAGDVAMMAQVEDTIADLLREPVQDKPLAKEIREMRALIEKEKGSANPFDVKAVAGGLTDIEFIAQWGVISHGLSHDTRHETSVPAILKACDQQAVPISAREDLLAAWELYNTVLQVLRLCIDEQFEAKTAPPRLAELLAHLTDMPDIASLQAHLVSTQKAVREHFNDLLG